VVHVSRIMGLFARDLTQEAGSSGSDTLNDDEVVDGVAMDEQAKVALEPVLPETGPHSVMPALPRKERLHPSIARKKIAPNDPRVRLIQNQCLKMSLALFNRTQRQTRSLGFTSALPGEGKTLMATITATALAERSHRAVTLVDCNWDNPTLHSQFGVSNTPGLAEWLRRECDLADIRRTISPYLTVIPSGDGLGDALALTDRFHAIGASAILTVPGELLIADLASVLTTDYGAQLPQMLDAVLLVVRAGATPEAYITEAQRELGDAALEGAVLNATRSSIPRWLLRLL
jgi:Mrp family chromosome partitioning ATPase